MSAFRTRSTATALRSLGANPRAPISWARVQQCRGYAYSKDEALESRNSTSNYSKAANDGLEGNTAKATVKGAPPSTPKEPPTSRPAYMIGIGGIVLAIGYGFITLLGSPEKAAAHHENLPSALTPGKGVDVAATRGPNRA
ncbi:hypothetical protein MCOR25_007507 [Pyricularia grisea]|uniref:Uncharacterized protein n=1 Tax=Pyricularia grisea TaxID=148305 RepID=A0A6P8BM56_PYRGI|nr:uncharacterized protein PgNI_02123 [Pyricularia grisea]KAI6357950.1 hypothetical protein MCOR25_007507 [Pyricularia grisea]TLD17789.1 hypothetical protein PgNI_02123 [Pyricularia grisea]